MYLQNIAYARVCGVMNDCDMNTHVPLPRSGPLPVLRALSWGLPEPTPFLYPEVTFILASLRITLWFPL